MTTKLFQVINQPKWACPGMLIWVDQENNEIIAKQQNPDNEATYYSPDEDEPSLGIWNPDDYEKFWEIKSSQDILSFKECCYL